MKKMYIAWICLIATLMLALIVIGYNISNKTKDYKAKEQDMIEQASSYITKNEIELSVGESIKLDHQRLIDAGLIKDMKVKEDECEGYVKVIKNSMNVDYKAYIKCKNYTSDGYIE